MGRSEDLDSLLYAWLSEDDARRAEVRFTGYFRAAFSAVCRYVRSLGAETSSAQDISQQSLIKLFNHLGLGRRTAAEIVSAAISDLQPLNFGSVHERLVRAWLADIAAYRDAALSFQISSQRESTWRSLREEVNARANPLVRQGVHFLREVHTRLRPLMRTLIVAHRADGAPSSEGAEINLPEDLIDTELRLFLLALLKPAERQDAIDIEIELRCVGSVGFTRRTTDVCENLPTLSIPSNGLLYTIAKRQFLDSFKGHRPQPLERPPDVVDDNAESVLEQLDFSGATNTDEEFVVDIAEGSIEERDAELEGRYRAFLEHLRGPLTRAEGALAQAALRGRAAAEQARADSVRAKYDRLMAVLTALRETPQPTEDQIAARLGVTRNQVKYAIERIREEFSHFLPDLARDSGQRRKRQTAD
jgi:DNA-directed RNA polymerase specialized sigma24 family protein